MRKIRVFFGDRTVLTMLLAMGLVLSMGFLRPDKPQGMNAKRYWATKIQWQNCADGVITGDSRALMAVVPEELEKVLAYRQIHNFCFVATIYTRQYMEAVERLFAEDAEKRAVFMGITPHSLTEGTVIPSNFGELSQLSEQEVFWDFYFGKLITFFEPMSFRDAMHGLIPHLASSHTIKEFKSDGWLAVHKEPPTMDSVEKYNEMFRDLKISEQMLENVMDYVRKWKSQGIQIYGFFVPSCLQMVEIEHQILRLDEEAFARDFQLAGGTWIDVDLSKYECFDGSHLQDRGAVQFSRDLAALIVNAEPREVTGTIPTDAKINRDIP